MLCIIFTKKKLLAGIKAEQPQLLTLKGQTQIQYDAQPMHRVLKDQLGVVVEAYQHAAQQQGLKHEGAIPTALAFPTDTSEAAQQDREEILKLIREQQNPDLKLIHSDNLVISFLYGIPQREELIDQRCVVLESIDDYTHFCYRFGHALPAEADLRQLGAAALELTDDFEYFPYKDFGRSAGSEQVLNELIKEFAAAGLQVDVKGQTQLALQLQKQPHDFLYRVSRNTGAVSLEAEAKITPELYQDLLSANREKIGQRLTDEAFSKKQVNKVVLLGQYLQNPVFRQYLQDQLQLGDRLLAWEGKGDEELTYMVEGLGYRAQQALHAENLRMEEEDRIKREAEKKAQITAELKVKEERESLLLEIQEKCVDPSQKENYEEMFVNRGIALGIPDVVVKWNISEVLSRIALVQESETIGLEKEAGPADEKEAEEKAKAPQEEAPKTESPESPETPEPAPEPHDTEAEAPQAPEVPAAENGQQKVEVQPTPQEEQSTVEQNVSVPVAVASPKVATEVTVKEAPATDNGKQAESKVQTKAPNGKAETKEKKEPKEIKKAEVSKPEKKVVTTAKRAEKETKTKAMPSLSDRFSIKGALPDKEFPTKRVLMTADNELKVIRLLPTEELGNAERETAFKKLYDKELKYYQEMSEISTVKEGKFYYRQYIERSTLKDYVKRIGLDKKLDIEALSSTDLKFILQVFKEVRELPVSHADLSEDNILVLAKRKWNLQKNVEIKFVGFTSEQVKMEDMIEQTHQVFSKLLGEAFYKDFRDKFQL